MLALIGSMRKLGNCELFSKAVSRGIPFEHDLRLVRLPALDIRPCTGCYRCLADGSCRIGDDLPFLIDQIKASDALIIASPVYFLGAHASVKALLDRAFGFFSSLDEIAGKPCLLVNSYGMKDRIGVSPQALSALASFLGLEVRSSVNLRAALPGEWLASKSRREMAERLGRLLFSEKRPLSRRSRKGGRACPFCGSDIVRMRRTDFLCTLCNGSFSLDDRGRAVKGRPGWSIGSIDFVRSHREWLKGMRERFLASRKSLLALSLPYKDTGAWIEPGTRPDSRKSDEM